MSKYFFTLLALIAGIMLPFSFAPVNIASLAIISPTLFLLSWFNATPKQAFTRGLLFGLGLFGFGAWWVFISIHIYGHATIPVAVLFTLTFILYLSLYPAIQAYFITRTIKSPTARCLLAFPSSWILFEWGRSHILSGFPWLLIGYSQMGWPLSGYAPIGGIWLVSFLVIFTSASIGAILLLEKRVWITTIVITLAFWIGGFGLQSINWSTKNHQDLNVTLIQGNIPQELKWEPDMVLPIIESYLKTTSQNWSSDLIIWPEGAITIGSNLADKVLDNLDKAAKKNNTTVMLGIPIVEGDKYYNGMLAVGKYKGSYKKRHLVPFGEYLFLQPLSSWVMNYFHIPMSSFSAGNWTQSPLIYNRAGIATFVCYETVYPELVRSSMPNAQLFVGITDDSWFGDSFAPDQHLQMMQMRALENARYLLSATNTGVTAVISPNGKVVARAPKFTRATLNHKVSMMVHETPWSRWGEKPVLIIILLLLLWSIKLSINYNRD